MSFICCMYQLFSCLEAKINISDRSNRVSAFDIFFFLRGENESLSICTKDSDFCVQEGFMILFCTLLSSVPCFIEASEVSCDGAKWLSSLLGFLSFFRLISASSFAADTHRWEPSRISARPLCFVSVPTSESRTGYEHRAAYIYPKQMIHCWAEILTYSIHSNKELRQIKRLIWVAFWCGQVRS